MLKTLSEAKKYAIMKVESLTNETVDENEKILIEDLLEEYFFEKIRDLVNEEKVEQKRLASEEELEGYLFYEIPNYTTILEETTAERLSEYLSQE